MRELVLEKTRLDNRYDIQKLLGRGSYAEIYLARDNRTGNGSPHQQVVIKALNVFLQEDADLELERTLIENFQNEAVALDRVRHPNVISRLGHGTARDLHRTIFHYLVLEFLPGGDLAALCKQAPLTLEKTLFYLEQVCAGLSFAHSKNVIHRDTKPHNLLLTIDHQTVKIADFGVAKIEQTDSPITRVGTNVYAAPEHSPFNFIAGNENATGAYRLTPAADVYSLAKTVYVLLSGEAPRKFVNAPITSFPENIAGKTWAQDVLKVLEQATQTDLNNRLQTVLEFWQEFTKAATASEKVEEATRVAARAVTSKANTAAVAAPPRPTGSLLGYSAVAPAMPSFNSLPNVQTAPQNLESLPERPRLVVELDAKQSAAQSVLNHVPAANKNQELSSIKDQSPNRVVTDQRLISNSVQNQSSQTESGSFGSKLTTRFNEILKGVTLRLAIVFLMLGTFVGILSGAYNYFQTGGYLPSIFPAIFARNELIVNEDANLRSTPNIRPDNVVNLVTKDSILRIVFEDDNWYKVEVIKQKQPERAKSNETEGWISKKVAVRLR